MFLDRILLRLEYKFLPEMEERTIVLPNGERYIIRAELLQDRQTGEVIPYNETRIDIDSKEID